MEARSGRRQRRTAIESPQNSAEDLDRLANESGPRRERDHASFVLAGDDIELSGATIADQDFIAASRQDIPRLIAEIRRLRRALAVRGAE
jgi:hypothetical protein